MRFPVPLQLEVMGLIWAILSILLFLANYEYKHWAFKYGAFLTIIISAIYLLASIYKTRFKP
jgi:hypothetical protein